MEPVLGASSPDIAVVAEREAAEVGSDEGRGAVASEAAATTPPDSGPWFVLADESSGIDFRNLAGPTAEAGKFYLLDCIGPGVAVLDFDGDGRLDLYFPQGRADSAGEGWALPAGVPADGGGDSANRLYRNLGDRRFEECADSAGLADRGYGFGALAFDYDADGDPDLYLTNLGHNRLFRNDDGRFVDVTADHPGLAGDMLDWSVGAAAADVDGDGDLDLYVCNYLLHDRGELDAKGLCHFMAECLVPCGPLGLTPQADRYYRNSGPPEYRFEEATADAGLDAEPGFAFQPLFTDVDGDDDLDLFVTNDSVHNRLFVNDGTGSFSECGLMSGVATGGAGQAEAGMGAAAGDVQGDGLNELYVTNFSTQHNSFYANLSGKHGRPWFEEHSVRAGVGHPTFFKLSWGCAIADLDLDGWLDVFVANGHVYPQIDDCPPPEIAYRQELSLFRGVPSARPRFLDESASAGPAFGDLASFRGSALADLDDDGAPDLVVVRLDEPPLLAWNASRGRGHWLQLTLETERGLDIGAKVVAEAGDRRWTAETRAGSSFLASEDPRVHLGLGEHAVLDRLSVRFHDGRTWSAENVPVDRHLCIRPGQPAPDVVRDGGDSAGNETRKEVVR
ncbi:MAG: CRTAC1 family protein [Planctomycetota bacterium]